MPTIPDWVQALAVPAVGVLAKFAVGGPGLQRRIKQHLDLLKETPERLQSSLDDLITLEMVELHNREAAKLTRKLNGGAVAALVFCLTVAGFAIWGVVTFDQLWLKLIVGAIGAFFIILAIAGVGSLYEPEEVRLARQQKKKDEKAARQQQQS